MLGNRICETVSLDHWRKCNIITHTRKRVWIVGQKPARHKTAAREEKERMRKRIPAGGFSVGPGVCACVLSSQARTAQALVVNGLIYGAGLLAIGNCAAVADAIGP